MTDLINEVNKVPNDQIQLLYQKYKLIIEELNEKIDVINLPYFVCTIDHSVNYIKEKYPNLNNDWKTWSVVLIKRLFFTNKINSVSDIETHINGFINYYNLEYNSHLNNPDIIYATDFNRDSAFIRKYVTLNI